MRCFSSLRWFKGSFISIHPSESEPERTIQVNTGAVDREEVQRNESGRTEASYKLLEENLSLLDRLRAKGEIVKCVGRIVATLKISNKPNKRLDQNRYLEQQMSSIDGDMAGVASTQTEEMDRLKEEETCLSDQEGWKIHNFYLYGVNY